VTNLGVTFNQNLGLNQHVQTVCGVAYSNIRKIQSIRHYLTVDAAKTLACTLVLSRLDYCNGLFHGSDKCLIRKLQLVQNSAAKLIFRAKKYDHVTPLLHSLHWLPVSSRIEYKIACICFDAKFHVGPDYIQQLVITYDNPSDYCLRSRDDARTLQTSKRGSASFGDRAFSMAAVDVWNSLPHFIRHSSSREEFRHSLKTYLFSKAYAS